jgi:Protein of unknown function (DUF2950)
MSHLLQQSKIPAVRLSLSLMLLVMILSLVSCRKSENVSASSEKTAPGNEAQTTFASPEEAGAALLKAAKSGDQASLLDVFGPDGQEVLFSGDLVVDKNALKDFSTAYETMHRWGKIDAGGEMLYVGAENFPFPIPLEKNSSGRWYFNTAEGADEVLARRIGRDELVAMAAIQAIANAQQQYFNQMQPGAKVQQYAQKFTSDEGKHNGLYWPDSKSSAASPLGQMGDFAKGAGYTSSGEKAKPFYGYNFRILTKQGETAKWGARDYIVDGNMVGGFAILAYPSEYQDSGIMTFIIGTDGIVYQKDLGEKTVESAEAMTDYNPGDGWQRVTK